MSDVDLDSVECCSYCFIVESRSQFVISSCGQWYCKDCGEWNVPETNDGYMPSLPAKWGIDKDKFQKFWLPLSRKQKNSARDKIKLFGPYIFWKKIVKVLVRKACNTYCINHDRHLRNHNIMQSPDLLNAIFRGYHTVKGGAGFLSLTELVEICHGAENVFDVMRNGQRSLTPELMDVILQATDVVVEMFEKVKLREPLEPADANLVDILHKLSHPETADENIFDSAASEAPAAESLFNPFGDPGSLSGEGFD